MEQFKSKIVVLCSFCNSMFKVASGLQGRMVTCAKCKKEFVVEAGSASLNKNENIDDSLLFCKIALNYGMVSEGQLESVLEEYLNLKRLGVPETIENIFVKKGFLSGERVAKINDLIPRWGLRQWEKKYAAYAIERCFLTNEKAKAVLVEQAKLFNEQGKIKRISDFLIESGEITRHQHETITSSMGVEPGPNQEKPPEQQKHAIKPASDFKPEPELVEEQEPVENSELLAETKAELKTEPASEAEGSVESKSRGTIAEKPKKLPEEKIVPEPDRAMAESAAESLANDQPALKTRQAADLAAEKSPPDSTVKPVAPIAAKNPIVEKSEPVAPELVSDSDQTAPLDKTPENHADVTPETETPPENNKNGRVVKKINGLVLTISADKVVALLQAPDGILPNTTVKSIRQMLEGEEICHGVVDDALIKGFLNSSVFREKPFKIAEGRPARKGSGGVVKYHFDTDPLTVGAVSESGDIDFKDRGEIPYVKEGALLAEITPPVIGENGVDIYGHSIEVPQIFPIGLRCEEGAEFSEDHLKVFAKNDGQPKLTLDDRLFVLSELKIPGDVGFETGHIEFDGNIVITGTIQSDFTVKGANITAEEVLAAEIIATGDVTILNGITGGKVTAEGNIKAKFVNRGDIKAFGNVVVEREIIDSKIKNSGGCQVTRGKIIASEISSKQGIEAVEIGTEMSAPSKFKIGVDDHINGEIEVIENQIQQLINYKDEIEAKMSLSVEDEKKTHHVIAELAQLQDRTQLSVTYMREKIDELNKVGNEKGVAVLEPKIEELMQTIKQADDDVNAQFDSQEQLIELIAEQKKLLGSADEKMNVLKHQKKNLIEWAESQKTIAYIKTRSAMFAGTTIIGAYSSRVIKETIRGANIREVENPDMAEGWEMKSV